MFKETNAGNAFLKGEEYYMFGACLVCKKWINEGLVTTKRTLLYIVLALPKAPFSCSWGIFPLSILFQVHFYLKTYAHYVPGK